MAIHDQGLYLSGTLDPCGAIKELNGQGLIDSQLRNENLTGTDFFSLAKEDAERRSLKYAVEIAAGGQTTSAEADFSLTPKNAGENATRLKFTFTPINYENGEVKEISFTAQGVSIYNIKRTVYNSRGEQLLLAAETAAVGLFFWDLEKDELVTTPTFNELYGIAPNETMTREKFSRAIHPNDIGLVNETIRRAHTEFTECSVDYRVMLEGKVRWLSVRAKTFSGMGNSAPFTLGSVIDVTTVKLSSEESTNLLAAEQQARDLAKDHFIAMVSHELRAPLNSILGWVRILLTKEVDEETRANALETIERSARVQAKLIGDLVDSSKIISGKLNLEFHPVNLSDAVAYVVESQKPAAQAKDIELNYIFEEELVVNADLNRLQQIFVNLLTNAIKFTPGEGMVNVFIEKEPGNVRVSIEDTGKGIRVEELPHIFESYYQGRVSESGDKSGLGLGLSIVSSLVRQHGGTVKAESRGIGQGAKFVVTFPLLNKTTEIPKKDEVKFDFPEEPLEKLHILLVEDNDDSREVLQIFFEQRGAQVAATSSVAEAMDHLSTGEALPDVIVSDISMPDEDGYSFIRRVRSSPEIKNIPAIALTALVSSEDERKLLASGYQYHHPKPFESERLIKEILDAVK